ncbi:MAG: hypothetical protein VXY11_00795 [Candidatus Thermoplasmatota archaeon]|nr:hypothetical protein [Candidatus Thermoplasmatota archaeon]
MGILNDGFAGLFMALTVPVLSKFPATARITCVSSGINLAYGQVDGRLVIGDDEISLSQINCMYEFPYGDLLVGTTESLQIFRDGKEISSSAHETGIESISGKGDYAVCIDGLGRAHIVDSKGEQNPINETSVLFAKVGHRIAIATESGGVSTYSQDGIKIWERPMRGDVGERITAIGWNGNLLVVAREGHGLVPGDEEALEVEYWREGHLENRFDVKRRVIAIEGPWMGLDMGGIMQNEVVVAELSHPAHTIIDMGENALVGSWFHLHMVKPDGIVWSVETQGMVEHLSSNRDGTAVLIAGSDQNDYTDAEPVVLIDSTSEPTSLVEESTAIDDWGEAPTIEIDADELYGNAESIEELAGIEPGQLSDAGNLLDALNDEIEVEEIITEEEDLMLALSLDAEEIIAPKPDAGGDQSLKAEGDGTAIVTLDGRNTEDPQERIETWSWVDDTGKEIANTPAVRVKLNRGNHRLELRIKDRDGRWSSDSIDVRIE